MSGTIRRICAVSGSRADYGLLLPVLRTVDGHPALQLQLAVTGSHLERRFGLTVDVIRSDGFPIEAAVPLGLDDDSAQTVTRALGKAVKGFAAAFERLQPDLVLVLGDRYEILGAAQAALIARVPVAHIAGGDVTEGAFDDAIRHAITKMAHLHLVTHEAAARRVRQLGESEDRIFVTGSPGIDQIRQTPLPDRGQLEQRLGMKLRERNLAITFHPATLDEEDALQQLDQLLQVLDGLSASIGLVFTGANADPRGQAINKQVAAFVATHRNAVQHASLGQANYYGLLAHADAVIGNSSSGLYEAPSFQTPTVNIGDRQKGRPKAASVIDCAPQAAAIEAAIGQAFAMDCSDVVNPYGDGHATERIMAVLTGPWSTQDLLRKRFVDRDCA